MLFGFLARSVITPLSGYYPITFAEYIREITFSLILMKAALDVSFNPIAPLILSISIIPSIVEGVVNAAMGRAIFGMELNFSYAFGFMLALVGTGVTLPSIFVVIARGFKVRQTLPDLLVICTTIENLIFATVFQIFSTYVQQELGS